jgi:hypothetical protein
MCQSRGPSVIGALLLHTLGNSRTGGGRRPSTGEVPALAAVTTVEGGPPLLPFVVVVAAPPAAVDRPPAPAPPAPEEPARMLPADADEDENVALPGP